MCQPSLSGPCSSWESQQALMTFPMTGFSQGQRIRQRHLLLDEIKPIIFQCWVIFSSCHGLFEPGNFNEVTISNFTIETAADSAGGPVPTTLMFYDLVFEFCSSRAVNTVDKDLFELDFRTKVQSYAAFSPPVTIAMLPGTFHNLTSSDVWAKSRRQSAKVHDNAARGGDVEAPDVERVLAHVACAFSPTDVEDDKVFRESCLDLTEGDIVEVVAGQLCCFFDPSLK
eukprot:g15801.t1